MGKDINIQCIKHNMYIIHHVSSTSPTGGEFSNREFSLKNHLVEIGICKNAKIQKTVPIWHLKQNKALRFRHVITSEEAFEWKILY
jgi:hypothetical protein